MRLLAAIEQENPAAFERNRPEMRPIIRSGAGWNLAGQYGGLDKKLREPNPTTPGKICRGSPESRPACVSWWTPFDLCSKHIVLIGLIFTT